MTFGTPFTKALEFREKCPFEGEMRIEADKPLKASFRGKAPLPVDLITFDYTIKRNESRSQKSLTIEATQGKMTTAGKEGSIDFTFSQKIRVDLSELKSTFGKKGVYLEEPSIEISNAFGQNCLL
jgi:hypothetical protein